MNEYTGSGFKPVSFVSPQNTNIGLVQFVLKCEGIEKQDEIKELPAEQKNETVWGRFTHCFKAKKRNKTICMSVHSISQSKSPTLVVGLFDCKGLELTQKGRYEVIDSNNASIIYKNLTIFQDLYHLAIDAWQCHDNA